MGPDSPNKRQPLAGWMVGSQGHIGGQADPATTIPEPPVIAAPATFDLGKYGDLQTYPCIWTVAGEEIAIRRPTKSVRTFLLVVNSLVIPNIITVMFDAVATANQGIMIPAGGNLFMDYFVPQGDVHVFSPIAGVIQCFYCNANVADARRVYEALSG